jgi:4-hydroxybutyrate CoA-transferase
MAELCKSGVVNGANNTLPGIASVSFAFGSREMHEYVHKNKDVTFYNLDWINDPNNIAKNKNLVGVNGTLCMDLTGQACSESIGIKQFSATGGQVDFARGISLSETSKYILALPSTFTTKEGEVKSKIDITLPPGSVVTTPRIEVDYVVTEYGVAHLKWKNLSQRAHEMIKIAHPDFRDELKFKAKKTCLI